MHISTVWSASLLIAYWLADRCLTMQQSLWDISLKPGLHKARFFFISWFKGLFFRFRVTGDEKKALKMTCLLWIIWKLNQQPSEFHMEKFIIFFESFICPFFWAILHWDCEFFFFFFPILNPLCTDYSFNQPYPLVLLDVKAILPS